MVVSVGRPHELPAPFDGQRQYSHQVHTAPSAADSLGQMSLTPGSGSLIALLEILLICYIYIVWIKKEKSATFIFVVTFGDGWSRFFRLDAITVTRPAVSEH